MGDGGRKQNSNVRGLMMMVDSFPTCAPQRQDEGMYVLVDEMSYGFSTKRKEGRASKERSMQSTPADVLLLLVSPERIGCNLVCRLVRLSDVNKYV